jgi:hypothetical protein
MQAMIIEAAAREQAGLDLISVDSATVRAHHHAAGMAVGPVPLEAPGKAVEQEKGLHHRGKTPKTTNPETTANAKTKTNVGCYDGGVEHG